MKKFLILFLMLLIGNGIVITSDASAKTTKKKTTKTTAVKKSNSTYVSQESQPITLMYKSGLGYDYYTLVLNPSGTVQKTYYFLDNAALTNNGMKGKYRASATYNGTWTKTYRLIGNNNRQYYYEINVDGQSLFYVPGYNYLYIGFTAFRDGNTRETYKIITSKPASEY